MEELFITTIHEGHVYYRGLNSKVPGTITDYPMWASDLTTARAYGPHIHAYRTVRNLKLIDITNTLFHSDFMARVNKYYNGDGGMDPRKGRVLAPIGLPDFKTQMMNVLPIHGGIYDDSITTSMKNIIDKHIGYFGGKHRYSIERANGERLDHDMVLAMKRLYPNADGYVSEIMWPSYHHNGFLRPETCFFNPITCIVYTGLEASIGGGPNNVIADDNLPEDLINHGFKTWDEILRIVPGKMEWNSAEDIARRSHTGGKKPRAKRHKPGGSGVAPQCIPRDARHTTS